MLVGYWTRVTPSGDEGIVMGNGVVVSWLCATKMSAVESSWFIRVNVIVSFVGTARPPKCRPHIVAG